jgi:glycosyltransferase involved in cell wall biosynthesis
MNDFNDFSRLSTSTMHVRGKFLYEGESKFYVKGVTYGTFKPDVKGAQFPETDVIEKDFALMAANGLNSVRTYTVPSIQLLNIAHKHNLKVMVGLPWEQHITFLDSSKRVNDIISRVKESVTECKKHPAILCFTIGNEIPAPIVRWYGKERIEGFLKKLYKAVKSVDEDALVTYVNYPTTEYLDLSFLDFDCFNVYLETPEKLTNYIARLHSLAHDRPLVLAEIGLDSMRNGVDKQAEVLKWQVENVFAKGCAGIFIFAWTDEWWRGGAEIEDWDFGLVDRNRQPKPALYAVSLAMDNLPVPVEDELPFFSVVVCTYNGSATIRRCLEGILKLDYPNYEVIVVNDGSKDSVQEIIKEYPVKLISTPNRGLSNARNTGMDNAHGEIIAYIDDDAFPDVHWLRYLAHAYNTTGHNCIGGPNLPPHDSEFISTCVANAPGGPVHVMVTDQLAEHVPGCNMTFRKSALKKIGGFDPIYRSAGDDVDACWRIQEDGGTIGFHPAALVWHLRRNSYKAYWRQQKGYGKAEALLEAKWPEKYNSFGHITWAGRIYGNGFTLPLKTRKDRIFHGSWGSALFQSVYEREGSFINSIPLMPEWYLISAGFGLFGLLGFIWQPLFILIPLFIISVIVVVAQAVVSARKNSTLQPEQKKDWRYKFTIVLLHLIQPVARLYGRIMNGLTPWRKRGVGIRREFIFSFKPRVFMHWSEKWRSAEEWLTLIEKNILELKNRVKRGDEFSEWDLEVRNGLFGECRSVLTIEEHGMGRQYIKLKCSPVYTFRALFSPAFFITLTIFAGTNDQWFVAGMTSVAALCFIGNLLLSMARAMNNTYVAVKYLSAKEDSDKIIEMVESENEQVEISEKKFVPRKSATLLNNKVREILNLNK